MTENTLMNLGKRERQLAEVLYRLGEAAVADVRAALPDSPSYSAVRTMLNLLVEKRVATYRREGKRYLYRPVKSKERARRSALRNVVQTFFGDEPTGAIASLLDGSAGKLSEEDLARMKQLIEAAERENR